MLHLIVGPLQCCLSFWNDLCPFIVLSTPTYPSDKPNLLSSPPGPSQISLSKGLIAPHLCLIFQCLYMYLIIWFMLFPSPPPPPTHRDNSLILLFILVQNLAYTYFRVDYGAGAWGWRGGEDDL